MQDCFKSDRAAKILLIKASERFEMWRLVLIKADKMKSKKEISPTFREAKQLVFRRMSRSWWIDNGEIFPLSKPKQRVWISLRYTNWSSCYKKKWTAHESTLIRRVNDEKNCKLRCWWEKYLFDDPARRNWQKFLRYIKNPGSKMFHCLSWRGGVWNKTRLKPDVNLTLHRFVSERIK